MVYLHSNEIMRFHLFCIHVFVFISCFVVVVFILQKGEEQNRSDFMFSPSLNGQ